jgi:hypothetical protein
MWGLGQVIFTLFGFFSLKNPYPDWGYVISMTVRINNGVLHRNSREVVYFISVS